MKEDHRAICPDCLAIAGKYAGLDIHQDWRGIENSTPVCRVHTAKLSEPLTLKGQYDRRPSIWKTTDDLHVSGASADGDGPWHFNVKNMSRERGITMTRLCKLPESATLTGDETFDEYKIRVTKERAEAAAKAKSEAEEQERQRVAEQKLIAEKREHAVRLSELTGLTFYEQWGCVIVRDPEKLIALLESHPQDE